MKVFIWQSINKAATHFYHTGGGLVVFAADEDRARACANATDGVELHPSEVPDFKPETEEKPTHV